MRKKAGFTLVELLIVIVVIAILAAIAVVAYNGIQNRARESGIASGLTDAKKKLAIYQVDNGNYPASGDLSAAGVVDGSVAYQYTQNGGGTGYCLTGTSAGTALYVTEISSPTAGACSGHGTGGAPVADNLLLNPSFETDTSTWQFVNSSGAGTITRVSSGSGIVSGSGAAEIYAPNTPTQLRQFVSGLAPSTEYTFSAYITQISGPTVTMMLTASDGAGSTNNAYFSPPIGTTTRYAVTLTTSASPGNALFRIVEATGSNNFTYRVDALMLEQSGAPSSYID